MENQVQGVVFWVGALAIIVGFNSLIYRIGGFALMPGEPRRLLVNIFFGLAVGITLGLTVPFGRRLLGSNVQLFLVLAGVVLLAVSLVASRRLQKRVAKAVAMQSPQVQAEYAKRSNFLRMRKGRALTAAMYVAVQPRSVPGTRNASNWSVESGLAPLAATKLDHYSDTSGNRNGDAHPEEWILHAASGPEAIYALSA